MNTGSGTVFICCGHAQRSYQLKMKNRGKNYQGVLPRFHEERHSNNQSMKEFKPNLHFSTFLKTYFLRAVQD